MPVTPYHFGPSGFVALIFRKWIDIPVFILANVIVDIEVLFSKGWPHHRVWHFHTLLIGAVAGAVWAVAAYPLGSFFKKIMEIICIPYQIRLWKMIISGVLGVWFHVLIDSVYHYDVQPFWPYPKNPLWQLLSQGHIKAISVALFFAAFVLYVIMTGLHLKKSKE